MKGLDVLGCPTVIATQNDPSIRKHRLEAIYEWLAKGKIRPHVCQRFSLDEFAAAMRAKWESSFVGGGVLEMPAGS
jgi:NADPH:quinone reductase-like Zn-dependent oxidoreductase